MKLGIFRKELVQVRVYGGGGGLGGNSSWYWVGLKTTVEEPPFKYSHSKHFHEGSGLCFLKETRTDPI